MPGAEPGGGASGPRAIVRLALVLALLPIGSIACARGPAPTVTPGGAANRPPFVRITCRPCSAAPGAAVTLDAEASDPDGDAVEYLWRAARGSLAAARAATVIWTAPAQPGAFPLAVTVTDGRGGAASDSITMIVSRQ